VPARDVQTILGHTRISTTLEIYTPTSQPAVTHSPGYMDCLTRVRIDPLLQTTATNGSATILDQGVCLVELGTRYSNRADLRGNQFAGGVSRGSLYEKQWYPDGCVSVSG